MKYNPLDGDRAAEEYDRKVGLKRNKKILDIFKLGKRDRLNGIDYNNTFEDYFEKTAYKNGFNSVKEY